MRVTMSAEPSGKSTSLVHLLIFVVALIPFSTSVLSVKSFSVAEMGVPLLFLITILDFAATGGKVKRFHCERRNMIGFFLGLFIFVILLNYIRNPLLPTSIVGDSIDESAGGFKTYYRYLNGSLVFLLIVYWTNRLEISAATVMQMFGWIVLMIVAIGFFVHFTGVAVPGLDSFKWTGKVTEGFGSGAGSTRLPILEQFSQIGFFLALTGAALFRTPKMRLLAIGVFILGVYLGGGRGAVLTTFGGMGVFLFLRRRFFLTGLLAVTAIFALLSIKTIHEMAPNPQIARLTDLGSLDESSVGRSYIYKYGLQKFLDNPLFGTGLGQDIDIGIIRTGYKFETGEFIEKQLRMGGHATHISLLKNLGLVGYIPFVMMWVAPMVAMLPVALAKCPKDFQGIQQWRQAQFVIIYFSAILVRMLMEGNGSELKYYVYLGLAAVILNEILRSRAGRTFLTNASG